MGDDLVERLRALDTCAVSDTLDRLGLAGVALGPVALTGPVRIAGRATTVALVRAGTAPAGSRHLGTAAVEASGPDSVIVVDNGGRTDVAGWGGILSLAAARRGVAGVVVDGACRDVDEARELAFPLYATCGVPRTARGRVVERAWNQAIEICGIAVAPGDLVIADASGVVFVGAERAGQVLELAEEIARREAGMAEQVRGGVPVSDVMGARYEAMLEEAP